MRQLTLVVIYIGICLSVLFAFAASAQREYIDDPALHIHEPFDTLEFNGQEIKAIRGAPGHFEAYWDIKGQYINNENIHLRRMKFFVNCNDLSVALSTIALGAKTGHMIQIILIPPGTEEWMSWLEIDFITTKHLKLICPLKVTSN